MLFLEKDKKKIKKGGNHSKQESPQHYFYPTINIDCFLIFIGICQNPGSARLISVLVGMVGYQYNCYHQCFFTILPDISAPGAN